jgi:hypothetical protein
VIKFHNRNQRTRSWFNQQELVLKLAKDMQERYRERFEAEFEVQSAVEVKEARLCKAAAWYYVTYHPCTQEEVARTGEKKKKKQQQHNKGRKWLLSFAWVMHELLGELHASTRS